jgi:hypothetical protein
MVDRSAIRTRPVPWLGASTHIADIIFDNFVEFLLTSIHERKFIDFSGQCARKFVRIPQVRPAAGRLTMAA